MKTLLPLALIIIGFGAFAQTSTSPDAQYVYCEVLGTEKLLSTKVNIVVDFGDRLKWFADNRMKDEKTGKPIVFNSMVDALNYMGKQGWVLAQAYPVTIQNQNVYHYLLKRSIDSLTEEEKSQVVKID
jgi:hypothetical protein